MKKNTILREFVLFLILTIISTLVFANKQSNAKLNSLKIAVQQASLAPTPIGEGGEGTGFGWSISIDGDRALVGAPLMLNHGVVYVFEYQNNNWVETEILMPDDGHQFNRFGDAVSLSGNTAMIGAHFADGIDLGTGAVYVFEFENEVDWNFKQKLSVEDIGRAWFGDSVNVYGDTAMISGPSYDDEENHLNDIGAVFVFKKIDNQWEYVQVLLGDQPSSYDRFGESISLFDDQAIISKINNSENKGEAIVFEFINNEWTQIESLNHASIESNDQYGYSVSISGTLAVIGAPRDDDNGENSGAAYVFKKVMGSWVFEEKIISTDGSEYDQFGSHVRISGSEIFVGAKGYDSTKTNAGSVYVYQNTKNKWSQTNQIFIPDPISEDEFGSFLGVSAGKLIVGSNRGTVYSFNSMKSNWAFSEKLTVEAGSTYDRFGNSVSIFGDFAAVGSYKDDDNGPNSGSVYIYEYTTLKGWVQKVIIHASDATGHDYFGSSVHLSENRLIVGAENADNNEFSSGAVYVFDLENNVWSQTTKLTGDNFSSADNYGASVSYSNNHILVGASGENSQEGSVYIYELVNNMWQFGSKLQPTEGRTNGHFGTSVSLSGNLALIGASGEEAGLNSGGAAYIFENTNDEWSFKQRLVELSSDSRERFGNSVSLSGDRALIGASQADLNGINNSGAAYIFERDDDIWNMTQKLTAPDSDTLLDFGINVSLESDLLIVGASGYRTDSDSTRTGAAFVYYLDNDVWKLSDILKRSESSEYGGSVSINENKVLVGADASDVNGFRSGAAFIYSIDPDVIFRNSFD
jgi:hypothetical protein